MGISVAKTGGIREAGYDERWLRDRIFEEPSCLKLGNLEVVSKVRRQRADGRLKILLKNPRDDSMYEVGIMLGDTDESHIIRTIEFWDKEKRSAPKRRHHAVFVSEGISRRFLSILQIFSRYISVIAIRVKLVESRGTGLLSFSKVFGAYAGSDDECDSSCDESYWQEKYPWTIDAVRTIISGAGPMYKSPDIRYMKNRVEIISEGIICFSLCAGDGQESLLTFKISDEFLHEVSRILEEKNICFQRKNNRFIVTCDAGFLAGNVQLLRLIVWYMKKSSRG